MIRLVINDTDIILKDDIKLRLELNNSFFNTDAIVASVVYPFEIPAIPNLTAFNYIHRTDIFNRKRFFDCQLYFQGMLIITGKLFLETVSSTLYKGSIIADGFSTEIIDKLITDLSITDQYLAGTTRATLIDYVDAHEVSTSEQDFAFPYMHLPNLYEAEKKYLPSYSGTINDRGAESANTELYHVFILIK